MDAFSGAISGTDSHLASVYTDALATVEDITATYHKLMYAFPNLRKLTDKQEAGFIEVFAEAVQYAGMTKQRLYDSMMNCICHKHQYGDLQIADIIDFDKRFKLYDYKAVCDKDGYFPIERNGEVYWVQGAELAQYGYKVENKKIVRI